VRAVLADLESAPVSERVRATLLFLRALTLAPAEVRPADVTALRAAGVSEEGIVHAVYVCALFNIADRVADAIGFEVPDLSVEPSRWRRGNRPRRIHA